MELFENIVHKDNVPLNMDVPSRAQDTFPIHRVLESEALGQSIS